MHNNGNETAWMPEASIDTLRARAALLGEIRDFFAQRDVLEVETPVLSRAGSVDAHIDSFATCYTGPGAAHGQTRFLHTSPEFPMKRLLAAASGPIYQICRVFRDGEAGRLHNPEFTLLEWYRPGYDHHRLMDEVEALLTALLGQRLQLATAQRMTYAQAFERFAGLNPHQADGDDLARWALAHDLSVPASFLHGGADRDAWLDLILSQCIEPKLGSGRLLLLYDYPASQAALARVRPGQPPLAERFEVYLDGIELANGFHELTDAEEQAARFVDDQRRRARMGRPSVDADQNLIQAMRHGLPACAGVAVGIDRVVMLALRCATVAQVMAFPWPRA